MQSYEAIFLTAYLIWTSLIYFRVSKYFQEKLLLRIITTVLLIFIFNQFVQVVLAAPILLLIWMLSLLTPPSVEFGNPILWGLFVSVVSFGTPILGYFFLKKAGKASVPSKATERPFHNDATGRE